MSQKIVINVRHGGFSLSPQAVKRIAELEGRECYFFQCDGINGPYVPMGDDAFVWFAFDIPNPNEVLGSSEGWGTWTEEQKKAHNDRYRKHEIENRDRHRSDPILVQAVEELGASANGSYAKLKVVEVPDGVEWEVEEYDGLEWIAEKHGTWS
jgi:hypothetical protein